MINDKFINKKAPKIIECLRLFLHVQSEFIHFQCKHTFFFNKSLYFIANYNFTYTFWCTCKNKIADIYRKKIGDVRNQM